MKKFINSVVKFIFIGAVLLTLLSIFNNDVKEMILWFCAKVWEAMKTVADVMYRAIVDSDFIQFFRR